MAAVSLIAGFAVAVGTGSRPLGGVVLAFGGLWCIHAWARRHGRRTAVILGCVGFGAFVLSHLLGLLIGAWPSVLLVSAVVAVVVWIKSDARPARVESSPTRVRPESRPTRVRPESSR